MKNKLFLAFAATLFAAITLFNLNLTQQEAASDITLAGVEMVAGAYDGIEIPPHSSTYSCRDESDYRDTYSWPLYTIVNRVCSAPACGSKYVRNRAFPSLGSCTVYYNFP